MSRLNLKGKAIVDEAHVSEVQSAFDILDDIDAKVEAMGLTEYPRPSGTPKPLTDYDVDSLTDQQLGAVFIQYTAFAQYVYGKHIRSEAAYRLAVASLKRLDSDLRVHLFAQDVPKAEIPALVKQNPRYQEFEIEVLKLFAMKTILEAHYKSWSKSADALSRIISLREQEIHREMRENSIKSSGGPRRTRPLRDFRAP